MLRIAMYHVLHALTCYWLPQQQARLASIRITPTYHLPSNSEPKLKLPSPPDGLLKRVSTRHRSTWFVRCIHRPTPKSNTLRRYFVRCHTTQESVSSVARWLIAR